MDIPTGELPALTPSQMAAVDKAMFDVCGLDVLQVMEVAGRAIAVWIRREHFSGDCVDRQIVVLCGSGGNGGDGLVAARYLAGWGAEPRVVLSSMPAPGTAAAHQLDIVRRLAIPEVRAEVAFESPTDLIVDGLLGFSGRGAPHGVVAGHIETANQQAAAVVAIDVPSGLDGATGEVYSPCIRAAVTVTLGLPKTGLLAESARSVTGRLVVADIGIPDVAFRSAGIELPLVRWRSEFVEIRRP